MIDKLTFTILENVLRTYSSSKDISTENLAVHLLKRDRADLEKLGKSILENVKTHIEKYQIALVESTVEAGSGSLPTKNYRVMRYIFLQMKFLHQNFLSL